MSRHSSPIDQRPFQPKAKLQSERSLEAQYGEVAIADVAEALHHMKSKVDKSEPPTGSMSNAA